MLAFAPAKGGSQPARVASDAAQPVRAAIGKAAPSSEASPVSRSGHAPAELASISPVSGSPVSSSGAKSSGQQLDWGILLTQLNVQGMAQQLAKNCMLESLSDSQITLCLAPEHKHLQANKIATEKLQAALSDYFAKPVKLNIVLGKTESATPAVVEQQAKQFKQQLASGSIAQDNFVREAQSELGASLITESIKPI